MIAEPVHNYQLPSPFQPNTRNLEMELKRVIEVENCHPH